MPGAIFGHAEPAYSADAGQGAPSLAHASGTTGDHTAFLVWYVIIGFVIPLLIFSGYKLGGFQFVFRSR